MIKKEVEKVKKMRWYWWLLIGVFLLLGIWTMVPASASKLCLLGYYAHCSFTPVSTLICWIIAIVLYLFGKRRAL